MLFYNFITQSLCLSSYFTGSFIIVMTHSSPLAEYIDYTQPVYVWREDTNSRQNTIQEIKRRATSEEDWPQVSYQIFWNFDCDKYDLLKFIRLSGILIDIYLACFVKFPKILSHRFDFSWKWDGLLIIQVEDLSSKFPGMEQCLNNRFFGL